MEFEEKAKQTAMIFHESLKKKDFKKFASFCRIYSDFSNDFIFLDYSFWTYAQKEFEKNRCKKDIVLKPRRIGFTTLELARDLFFALTNPGSTVMIVAQEFSLSKKAIQDIKNFIEYIQEIEKKIGYELIPKLKTSNVKEIIFEDNTRIIGEQAKNQEGSADRTGRGIGIKRLHCTEVAFWSYPDLTMKSLMIAAKSAEEIVIESTANGANGYFYKQYMKIKEGEIPGWRSHFFPWYMHKAYKVEGNSTDMMKESDYRLRDEYEVLLKETIGINWLQLLWWRQQIAETDLKSVLQEFPIDEASCFQVSDSTFLTQEDILSLYQNVTEPIKMEPVIHGTSLMNIWKEPLDTKTYVIGSDASYGRGQDYSACYVVELDSGEICASYSNNNISPTEFADILIQIGNMYNEALIAVEIQGPGQAVISSLQAKSYNNLYKSEDKEYHGWNTTANKRIELFNLLQKIIKQQDPKMVDISLCGQCRTLIYKDGKIQHPKGYNDDLVISFMIAEKVRELQPPMETTGYQSIKRSVIYGNGFGRIGNQNGNRINVRMN